MCAYNRFNQTSSCHNKGLLTNLLRKEGGFKGASCYHPLTVISMLIQTLTPGFIISDWGATHDSVEENVDAGLDME